MPGMPAWAAAPNPSRADVMIDTAELMQPKGEDGLTASRA